MPSPFPGMNPYLEHPELWSGVHLLLIADLTNSLAPQLRPKYRVSIEVRVYETTGEQGLLVGIPDLTVKRPLSTSQPTSTNVITAEPSTQPLTVILPIPEIIRQGYLEVREVVTGEVVTVIEILSPVNKRPGEGRKTYENKRQKVLGSLTHLVEIDLLRSWKPMPIYGKKIESDYRILVSRNEKRPQGDLYTFNLQDKIPTFPLPLKAEDKEPIIDLQTIIDDIYDRAGYDLVIDYSQEPIPNLSEQDTVWVDNLLKEQGLR
jgi:hypothetical protein